MNAINIVDRGPNMLPIVTVDDNKGNHVCVMFYKLERRPCVASNPSGWVKVDVMLSLLVLPPDVAPTTGAANAHAGEAP